MDTSERSFANLAVWRDQPLKLKDLSNSQYVPGIIKVTRGQYRNIGTDRGLADLLYVHSVQTSQKILTENIKVNGNRIVRSDQKYSLPITYQGWFELMSEDGKPINAINSAQDLSKIFRHWCLVRENFRAPISENGVDIKMSVDQTRLIKAGERLNLRDEIITPVKTARGNINKRFLRCVDEQGKSVFLSFEQNTFLSPIAGSNNISGVHTLKGLLEKFRFPITVRLVHGAIPMKMEKNWSSVFRFIGTYTDETVFVLPLKKDATMMTISTREPLQVVEAKNIGEVRSSPEFQACSDKCSTLLDVYNNSIHVLVDLPHPRDVVRSAKSNPDEGLQNQMSGERNGSAARDPVDVEEEDLLFEEIEEIYRYVRDGGDPPEPKPRTAALARQAQANVVETVTVDDLVHTSNYAKVEDLNKPQKVEISNTIVEENDYWEEPIYADIAEIQERKRKVESITFDNIKDDVASTAGSSHVRASSSNLVQPSPVAENVSAVLTIEDKLKTELPLVPAKNFVEVPQTAANAIQIEPETSVKILSPVSKNGLGAHRVSGLARLGPEVAQRMSFFEERCEKNIPKLVPPKVSSKVTTSKVSDATSPTNKMDTEMFSLEIVNKIERVHERPDNLERQYSSKRVIPNDAIENISSKETLPKNIWTAHQGNEEVLKASKANNLIGNSSQNNFTYKHPSNDSVTNRPMISDIRSELVSTQKPLHNGQIEIQHKLESELKPAGVLEDMGPRIQEQTISEETEVLRINNRVATPLQNNIAMEIPGLLKEVEVGMTAIHISNGTSTLGTGLRSEIGVGSRRSPSELGQVGRTVIPVTTVKSSTSVIGEKISLSGESELPLHNGQSHLLQINNTVIQPVVEKNIQQATVDARNSNLTDASSGSGTTLTVVQDRTIMRVNSGSRPNSGSITSYGASRSPSFGENNFNYSTTDRNSTDLRQNVSSPGITTVHVASPAARMMSNGGQTFSASRGKSMPQIVQLSNSSTSPRTNTLVRVQQSAYTPQGSLSTQSASNGVRGTPFIVNASVLGRSGGATVQYNNRYF